MRIFGILSTLLMMVSLASCATPQSSFPKAQRSTPPPIPSYPNIQDKKELSNPDTRATTTTFHVNATPEQVLNFYKSMLIKGGWKLVDEQENKVNFGNYEACPYYALNVQVSQMELGETSVELFLFPVACVRG